MVSQCLKEREMMLCLLPEGFDESSSSPMLQDSPAPMLTSRQSWREGREGREGRGPPWHRPTMSNRSN